MSGKSYLAIDIGAESGRLILGTLCDGKVQLKEIHRFSNGMVCILGKYHWNIVHIYQEILKGLEICAGTGNEQPFSIGIDTWGVDYGLLDGGGNLLGLPFAYRDLRTMNAIEEFSAVMPKRQVYGLTGTLFAPYNTLFQLYAASKQQPDQLKAAKSLLFVPDLLAYWLTGYKVTDFSFAATSQLYNPFKKNWEQQLFDYLGLSAELMQQVVEPGTLIGNLHKAVCDQTGIGPIPVYAVATHDTNSAVAAIPAIETNWAFISSGTWSLMGFESREPVINDLSYSLNFTNEGGVSNTFNVLKNHMGLWLLQQCRKSWKDYGYDYGALVEIASMAAPFLAFIDIDHELFLNPSDMPAAIAEYCRKTGQKYAFTHAETARLVLEGIAFKYRRTFDEITLLRQQSAEVVYITGGGTRNRLLCAFAANACGVPVKTALAEGSATGNVLTQALGAGHLSSLAQIRQVAATSCRMDTYLPVEKEIWNEAYQQYQSVTNNIQL
ncbi:MAG: rhamnulokinase family protein [Breznakibacter sp.]